MKTVSTRKNVFWEQLNTNRIMKRAASTKAQNVGRKRRSG